MSTPTRVTIQDVARLADVSVATVSAVLTGKVRVSEERTRRVHSAVQALRYSPDARARMLRTGRSQLLGVVVPDVTNPFYPDIVRAIEKAARARGYSVVLCDSANDTGQERLHLEALCGRKVDGVLVACVDSRTSYEWLTARGLPAVFFERIPVAGTYHAVSTDHAASATGAARFLIELGHRRIGFMATDLTLSSNAARWEAIVRVLSGKGLPLPERHLVSGIFTAHQAQDAMRELLGRPNPPTALLCSNSVLVLGCAAALRQAGLRCPEDLSLMCFDNPEWTEFFPPAVTTRAQPIDEIAATAVTRVLQCIDGPPDTAHTVWLQDRLVPRASTGPAPARRKQPR